MKKYILLIAITILYSCGTQSETPIAAVERLKALACASDVEGFYTYVDKPSVDRNLKIISSEVIKEDIGDNPGAVKEFEEFVIPSLIVLKWEIITSEIESGQQGSFCNMEVFHSGADPSSVNIIYPDGKSSIWSFEEKQGQLVLVSIEDQAPFDFAGLDLELHPKPESDSQTKEDAIIQADKAEEIEPVETPDKEPETVSKAEAESDAAIDERDIRVKDSVEESTLANEKLSETAAKDEPVSSAALSKPGFDFGSAQWGMTKEQVIAIKGSKPVSQSQDSIRYIGSYNGSNAELIYTFSSGRLFKGRYIILESATDEASYLREYESLKRHLTSNYGEPQSDQENWANTIYKDRPDRHGFAVYIGHLSYRTKWVTSRSDILLELKSHNYYMLLEAVYYPN